MKPSPRLVLALLGVIGIALFFATYFSRAPQMPTVAPGSNARTMDAPDH